MLKLNSLDDLPAQPQPKERSNIMKTIETESATPETDALSETMCRTAKMEKWRNLARSLELRLGGAESTSKINFDIATGYHTKWQRAEKALAMAHESLREMIDLNDATGDPDPEITDRARAIILNPQPGN